LATAAKQAETSAVPPDFKEVLSESAEFMQVPATWGAYLRLVKARGDLARPKYTYLDGVLTIMSPGYNHEHLKSRLSWMVETALVLLPVNFLASGELTLRRGGRKWRKAAEGDASYYLTNLDKVAGKARVRMSEGPPPDLVVEVVISHDADESLKVYAAFGVREVWVCDARRLRFLVLGGDGAYAETPTSVCLPFLSAEEFGYWTHRQDVALEAEVRGLFFRWVTDVLAPRARPQAPPGGEPAGAAE
jgi:Uma2 family endonuclease